MKIKQFFRATWIAATATGLLLAALNALGSIPTAQSDAQSNYPAASSASLSDIDTDGSQRHRRLSSHRLRHSLRMPFFSFQPLG